MPEWLTNRISEDLQDKMLNRISENISKNMSDKIPDNMPKYISYYLGKYIFILPISGYNFFYGNLENNLIIMIAIYSTMFFCRNGFGVLHFEI
jgi:hypothetical protein